MKVDQGEVKLRLAPEQFHDLGGTFHGFGLHAPAAALLEQHIPARRVVVENQNLQIRQPRQSARWTAAARNPARRATLMVK